MRDRISGRCPPDICEIRWSGREDSRLLYRCARTGGNPRVGHVEKPWCRHVVSLSSAPMKKVQQRRSVLAELRVAWPNGDASSARKLSVSSTWIMLWFLERE